MVLASLHHHQPSARLSSRSQHAGQRLASRAPAGVRVARPGVTGVNCAAGEPQKQEVIAVTGATGFVGKALVKKLVSEGAKVRVLTRCDCVDADRDGTRISEGSTTDLQAHAGHFRAFHSLMIANV